MSKLVDRLSQMWCESMHPTPMWPIHGRYQCPQCLRTYDVGWANESSVHELHPKAAFQPQSASEPLKGSALRPILEVQHGFEGDQSARTGIAPQHRPVSLCLGG